MSRVIADGLSPRGKEALGDIGQENFYRSEVVVLDGDFNANQEVLLEKVGQHIVITSDRPLDHTSGTQAVSAVDVVPSWAIPINTSSNVYSAVFGGRYSRISVNNSGQLVFAYYQSDGSGDSSSNTSTAFSITYRAP